MWNFAWFYGFSFTFALDSSSLRSAEKNYFSWSRSVYLLVFFTFDVHFIVTAATTMTGVEMELSQTIFFALWCNEMWIVVVRVVNDEVGDLVRECIEVALKVWLDDFLMPEWIFIFYTQKWGPWHSLSFREMCACRIKKINNKKSLYALRKDSSSSTSTTPSAILRASLSS